MAFCTSCGAQVSDTSQFCTKCGKPLPAAPAPPMTAPSLATGTPAAVSPPRGSSHALTVVLVIIAIVVALGLIAAGITAAVVHHIARHSRVTTTAGGARVETPFGTIQTTNDTGKIAASLGDDMYPGATVNEGGSDVNLGGKHIVTANLATNDPPDKVADYYKQRYPSSISSQSEGKASIVHKDGGNVVSIAIENEGGKTLIHISRITRG